jgi:RHS repeat-associated protein
VQRFAYDGWDPAQAGSTGTSNFNIWADLDGNGSLTTRYLRGDALDQLFARMDFESNGTANPFWYLTDQQGSVRDVTDSNGVVVDTVGYDAYGNVTSETNPAERGRYGWTGREVDVETGLQYNRARWYDSTTGRWLSQDPLGFDAGDSNLYRYVNNRPTYQEDPSGLEENGFFEQLIQERERELGRKLDPLERFMVTHPGSGAGSGFSSGAGQKKSALSDAGLSEPPPIVVLVIDQAKLKEVIEARASKAKALLKSLSEQQLEYAALSAAIAKRASASPQPSMGSAPVVLTDAEWKRGAELQRSIFNTEDDLHRLIYGYGIYAPALAELQAEANLRRQTDPRTDRAPVSTIWAGPSLAQQAAWNRPAERAPDDTVWAGPSRAQEAEWKRRADIAARFSGVAARVEQIRMSADGRSQVPPDLAREYNELSEQVWQDSPERMFLGMVPVLGNVIGAGEAIRDGRPWAALFNLAMAGLDVSFCVSAVGVVRNVAGSWRIYLRPGNINPGGITLGPSSVRAAATTATPVRPIVRDPTGAINLVDPVREPENNYFLRNILRRADVDPDGFLDLVAHGNDRLVLVYNSPANPEYLAQVILSDPAFNGRVRLLSCLTGAGENSFAQKLANELQREFTRLGRGERVVVRANNGFLHAADDGTHYLTGARLRNGEWVPAPRVKAEWMNFTPTE